jgi:hypothetical protein
VTRTKQMECVNQGGGRDTVGYMWLAFVLAENRPSTHSDISLGTDVIRALAALKYGEETEFGK